MARCEPTPNAKPSFCAAAASARLISRAGAAPPVMPEMTTGLWSVRPKSETEASTSSSESSGSASCSSCTSSSSVVRRASTSPSAQSERCSSLRSERSGTSGPEPDASRDPQAPRPREAQRGAEAREASRVELVEERAVDPPHRLGRAQEPPLLVREQRRGPLVAEARALRGQREEQPQLLGHPARAQARRVDAE